MAPAAAALRQVGGDNDPVADKANKDLTAHSKRVEVVRGGRRVYEGSLHKCCSVDLSPPQREWGGAACNQFGAVVQSPLPPLPTPPLQSQAVGQGLSLQRGVLSLGQCKDAPPCGC